MRRVFLASLLVAATARADHLRVDYVRESLTGTYTRYQQFIGGIEVVGGERIEGPRGVHESLARRGFSHVESAVASAHRGDLVYVNAGGIARLAIREKSGGARPVLTFFDASTGEVLRTEALAFNASGRVFDVNPVAGLNDHSLQDHNNSASAVPDAAYAVVDLPGLAPSGALTGINVQIVDAEAPFTMRADASQPLLFDRSDPRFEEVNAYFHVDRSQRYLQSLGYTGQRRVVNYAIPVDAHALDGKDNSFFLTGAVRGRGQLFFGDGGTDDAEDSDIMIHEFAHAIHESIAPDAFNGSPASQARALAEGFADYWAFSAKYARAIASGSDPYCIGDWDARCGNDDADQRCGYAVGATCLRRVDSAKTMDDFLPLESSGMEHRNGEIWSSALREIHVALVGRYGLDQGRRAADTTLIESLFGTPTDPTFAGEARKLLAADLALTGGVNSDVICRAMTERRILAVGDCGAPPRGERTVLQSATSIIHIDDPRAIADLTVRVQTNGAAGSVKLIAPDETSVLLTVNPRIDATYGLDAVSVEPLSVLQNHSAAGDWTLVVEGAQLRSWSLSIRYAGDVRLATRPVTGGLRKHIPAVAHVIGAADALFVSDVRVFNRSNSSASLLAIFTPSGADGTTAFAAVRLVIEPQAVMVLNDVVRGTLLTSGIGQLELLGDTDRVIVNSRTYTIAGDATYGETIPGFDTAAAGADEIAPLQNATDYRSNVGVAEVGGRGGVVRFSFFTAGGVLLGSLDLPVAAYGHAQARVPVLATDFRAEVTVLSGNPLVLAYGSVVDNRSGDATTIPAARLPQSPETVAIPATSGLGAGGTNWHTDLWQTTAAGKVNVVRDAAKTLEALFSDSADIVSSRTYTTTDRGTCGEFIPAIHEPLPAPQELIGIEQSDRFRTNLGLVNFGSAPAAATVVVYDASGRELARSTPTVAGRSLQQLPLATIVATTLTNGRIEIRGAVAAYASVIDNGTKDPSYIAGQY